MIDICFIILNYNLYEETLLCVESIHKKIDTDNYKIIIVDNASPNGAGEILKNKFRTDSTIEVVLLPNNTGFARGNNVGIEKARKEGATYICCINDDAELISDNFFRVVHEKYQKFQPAVIGPKVINANGEVDEFYHPLRTIEEYEQMLHLLDTETYGQYKKRKKLNLKFKLRQIVDSHSFSRKIFQTLKFKISGVDPYARREPKYTEDTMDLVMVGCCVVFTPVFFEYLSGFDESTFLYYEEEFLAASLFMFNLHSLYTPEIEIYHKGGISTETVTGEADYKKWLFRRKTFSESLKTFVNFLNEHKGEIY